MALPADIPDTASTVAPEIGVPAVNRVTVPAIDPGTMTVKGIPPLAAFATVTTTSPLRAPVGTGATIRVLLQVAGVAVMPLKVTLVPFVEATFDPVIVI